MFFFGSIIILFGGLVKKYFGTISAAAVSAAKGTLCFLLIAAVQNTSSVRRSLSLCGRQLLLEEKPRIYS